MAKRPSLVNVMDKGSDAPQTFTASAEDQAQPVPAQRKPGKKKLGWVQLNSYVPEDLRTRAKVKALQQDRDLSDIVTELLEVWVASD